MSRPYEGRYVGKFVGTNRSTRGPSESSDAVTLGAFSKGWRERPEEFAVAAVDGGAL